MLPHWKPASGGGGIITTECEEYNGTPKFAGYYVFSLEEYLKNPVDSTSVSGLWTGIPSKFLRAALAYQKLKATKLHQILES